MSLPKNGAIMPRSSLDSVRAAAAEAAHQRQAEQQKKGDGATFEEILKQVVAGHPKLGEIMDSLRECSVLRRRLLRAVSAGLVGERFFIGLDEYRGRHGRTKSVLEYVLDERDGLLPLVQGYRMFNGGSKRH